MATNISFSTYGFMNGILILSEENWRTFFKPFITDSVQSGLATIAGANMTVYVSAGECRCGAVMGILDEMIALDIADGDSTYNRIDSVVVQYTYGEPSTLAVAIVQGIPSANPVPPTLTKVYDTLWQMEIAQILVPSGATSASEFTITDKRVIYESIESIIDDNTESEERAWSSQKTHEEIVSLSTEIYDSLNTKADAIERTVSGDIVTITDGGDNIPVKELVVGIEPVQDLNGYDAPWPAGGGKNLAVLEQGTLNTNTGLEETSTTRVRTNFIPVVNGSTYVASSNGWSIRNGVGYDANKNYVRKDLYPNANTGLLTITEERISFVRFIYSHVDTSETCTPSDFWYQFELGSSATSFAPYENICPISGWESTRIFRAGKNLLNPANFDSATVLVSDGIYTFDKSGYNANINTGQAGASGYTVSAAYFPKLPFLQPGTYVWSYKQTSGSNLNRIWSIDNTGEKTSVTTTDLSTEDRKIYRFTITEPTMIIIVRASNTNPTVFSEPQLELGSEFTGYEPYVGDVLPISWETEAGTVYGGSLDVLTGMLTVDRQSADFETMGWTWRSESETWRNQSLMDIILLPSSSGVRTTAICENYRAYSWNSMFDDHSLLGIAITSTGNLMVRTGSSSETPKGKMAYPLASPQTILLTPAQMQTLLGENHIWADTGDVLNLTYRADTKKYIEQKVADTNRKTCEMMTIVTDKMIAPNNLVIGDLVIVNNDLYKATANIASGATMMVGTNVQKLTLAEYIQSLL